jgi:hypothetical protein
LGFFRRRTGYRIAHGIAWRTGVDITRFHSTGISSLELYVFYAQHVASLDAVATINGSPIHVSVIGAHGIILSLWLYLTSCV